MLSAIDIKLEAICVHVDKVKLKRYRKKLLGYLQKIRALGPWQVGSNLLLHPDVNSSSSASQDGRECTHCAGYMSRLGKVVPE